MLRGALASLMILRTGSRFGFEILVIDDGSVDETSSVVQSLLNGSPVDIRYIRQDNAGVAAARNTGVRHARGNWIAFFDDDELADRDWLSRLFASAQSTGADCISGQNVLMLPNQVEISPCQHIRRLLGENSVMRMQPRWVFDSRRQSVPGTGNALVRRELFDRVGLFSEAQHYGEDLEFFRKAQNRGARFAIAPGAIIHHVIPLHRLTPSYLLPLAGKGGATAGQIDFEVIGKAYALWIAAMRSVHLVFWTLPGLFAFWLRRDPGRILSKRISVRFDFEYLAAVVSPTRRRLAGRAC